MMIMYIFWATDVCFVGDTMTLPKQNNITRFTTQNANTLPIHTKSEKLEQMLHYQRMLEIDLHAFQEQVPQQWCS